MKGYLYLYCSSLMTVDSEWTTSCKSPLWVLEVRRKREKPVGLRCGTGLNYPGHPIAIVIFIRTAIIVVFTRTIRTAIVVFITTIRTIRLIKPPNSQTN